MQNKPICDHTVTMQALLDLYTIEKKLGHIDDLTIAVVGDLAIGFAR